jgi:hypothetical protein
VYPIEAFQEAVMTISTVLSKLKIPFHLTGGAAVIAYSEPRLTQDIDIVVEPSVMKDRVSEFLSELRKEGFSATDRVVREAVTAERMFQILHLNSALKVDFYPRELAAGETSRSVLVELFPSVFVPIASLRDTSISKLIWISKGSHKGRRDLRQLLLRASADEIRAVRDDARQRGLEPLLDEVLAEPDEIDA